MSSEAWQKQEPSHGGREWGTCLANRWERGAFWEDGKNVCVRGRDHKQPMDVACVCVCVKTEEDKAEEGVPMSHKGP